MEMMKIMDELLKALVIACVPILTAFLVRFINAKVGILKSNGELQEHLDLIMIAEQAVIDVVIALNQTIVDTAKLEGKFDKSKQQEAFMRAKNDIQMILSSKTKEAIKIIYGNFDIWLETKIEAVVNENKIVVE